MKVTTTHKKTRYTFSESKTTHIRILHKEEINYLRLLLNEHLKVPQKSTLDGNDLLFFHCCFKTGRGPLRVRTGACLPSRD